MTKVQKDKRNKQKAKYNFQSICLIFVLLEGLLLLMRDFMYSTEILSMVALAGGIFSVLFCIVKNRFGNIRIVRIIARVTGIVCLVLSLYFLANGFLDTVNRGFILWNYRFDTEIALFSVSMNKVGSLVFWVAVSIGLTILLTFLIKRERTGLIVGLMLMVFLFTSLMRQKEVMIDYMVFGAGFFLLLSYAVYPDRKLRLRNEVYVILLAAGILAAVSAVSGYQGSSGIARWKEQTADWIQKVRFGEDTLPQGEFSEAGGLLDGEEETLIVQMDDPSVLYLKGFVGGTYSGDHWEPLVKECYQGEYQGILEWMGEEEFSPITQYAFYDRLTKEDHTDFLDVQVQNVGAYRKYMYLPAAVSSWDEDGARPKKDWQVQSKQVFGTKEYEFTSVHDAVFANEAVVEEWMSHPEEGERKHYQDVESVYHAFVQQYYQDIDPTMEEELEKIFVLDNMEEMDFSELTAYIRIVLSQHASYTDTPQEMPRGEDFVLWFLEDAGSGNAVHFASAAVMAYRLAGYSARYVEGYCLTAQEAEEMKALGIDTMTLTTQNAHAWAEVYVAGMGWLPVEVVPGMYAENNMNQVVEGKPTYELNPKADQEGPDTEDYQAEGSEGDETSEEESEHSWINYIPACLVLIMYLILILYLLAELQRLIRIRLKRSGKQENSVYWVNEYAEEMMNVLRIAGVKGSLDAPFEMQEQIAEKFPGIHPKEYQRAIEMIQKVIFGEAQLHASEKYTLNCFMERMKKELYREKNIFRKAKIRYLYAI